MRSGAKVKGLAFDKNMDKFILSGSRQEGRGYGYRLSSSWLWYFFMLFKKNFPNEANT